MAIEESTGEVGLFVTSARYLIRGATVACLATLEPGTGSPYASMITVATETGGAPVILISRLAWHTRNLEADPRASILFMTQEAQEGDPLALGRVSVMGVAEKTDDARARERFLARHPEAAGYAGFADFAFWRLNVEKAHYVGGFGRIGTLPGESLLRRGEAVAAWDARISRLLAECPTGLASALARRNAQPDADWRIVACDPEGCDLVAGDRAHHLAFPQPVEDVNQIPEVLQRLASGEATSS
jgi:putative heme iron utilization protein